eukprot:386351-Rhodomonas_salina.2
MMRPLAAAATILGRPAGSILWPASSLCQHLWSRVLLVPVRLPVWADSHGRSCDAGSGSERAAAAGRSLTPGFTGVSQIRV